MTLMSAKVVVLADITQLMLYKIPPNVLTAVSILKKKKAQNPQKINKKNPPKTQNKTPKTTTKKPTPTYF